MEVKSQPATLAVKPAISIVISVYNGTAWLPHTLASLQAQTFTDFEVLCVDDFSTDDSVALLEGYAAADPRIRILKRTTKGGYAVSGQAFGLPHCRGEYFFYLSQDDFISPDCLEQLHRRAQETGADAVLPDMNWYYGEDEQGHPIEPSEGKPKGIIGPPEGDYSLVLDGETAFLKSIDWQIHGFSLRKTKLLQALGFDELYFTSCEYMARRFYLNSNKVAFSHGTVYFRQNNPTAITKTFSHLFFGDYATYVRLLRLMVKHRLPKSTVAPYLKDYTKRWWPQQKALYAEHKASFTPQQQAYVATIFRRVLWDLLWVSVAQGHGGNLWRVLKLVTKRPKPKPTV